MANQAMRNGTSASRDRQNNGVIEGASSFATDLATLAVLQLRLATCDLRESTKTATPIVSGLIILGTVAGASTVIGLAGFSLWLASILNIQAGTVMMVVALVGLVVSGAGAALLARSLTKSFSHFRRSQEELERNLAWIKTTLVHSGAEPRVEKWCVSLLAGEPDCRFILTRGFLQSGRPVLRESFRQMLAGRGSRRSEACLGRRDSARPV